MLDNGTKKRIDSARDILVGKVPDPKSQVEQITIAMIYKFMDDMDNQTEELGGKATFFAGEFKQYAWSRLLDSKLGGHERLILYAEGIEKMNINENIPQLFRDIFKGAFLPYRDPETLNLFLKEINGFAYDHSERLGDAFEYLLSVLSSQGDAGQFRTPRHIIDFIVEIVNPAKEDTVLDPACGTAGFLISSYKHILRQNTKSRPGDLLTTDDKGRLMTNFCGYDISPDMVRLSLVNMYLHSFANPSIYEYDTLTSEDRWDERYDVILANPPFMSPKGGIRPHSRFTIKAKRSEVLFVDYIAEHLNVHGRAGVIVPEGIIFQSQNAYKNLRKMLVDEGYLYAVVSLPSGVFQPYSGVKTSILLMDKTLAKKTDEILFVKVANDGFDLGAQRRPIDKNDLPQALKIVTAWKQAIVEGKGFEIDEDGRAIAHTVSKKKIAESGDYNLSGDRYRDVVSYANVKWPIVKLREVCKLIGGYAFKSSNLVDMQLSKEYLPVVKIGNIVKKGNVSIESIQFHKYTKELKKYLIKQYDILIAMTGATVGKVAAADTDNLLLNQRVGLIRPETEKIDQGYTKALLFSDIFYKYCQATAGGGAQGNISPVEILNFAIPLPPLEVQEKIVAELDGYQKIIDGAKQVVENYKPTIKIDPDWPMVKLGEVCNKVTDSIMPKEFEGETTYIGLENIDANSGAIRGETWKDITKIKSTKLRFTKEDILYGKLRPNLNKVWFSNKDGICSTDIMVLRFDRNRTSPFFYSFILRARWFNKKVLLGISGAQLPRVNYDYFETIPIPLPPLETQEKIAAEIESERKLVEANKKLIEIFEKKINDKIGEVWGE